MAPPCTGMAGTLLPVPWLLPLVLLLGPSDGTPSLSTVTSTGVAAPSSLVNHMRNLGTPLPSLLNSLPPNHSLLRENEPTPTHLPSPSPGGTPTTQLPSPSPGVTPPPHLPSPSPGVTPTAHPSPSSTSPGVTPPSPPSDTSIQPHSSSPSSELTPTSHSCPPSSTSSTLHWGPTSPSPGTEPSAEPPATTEKTTAASAPPPGDALAPIPSRNPGVVVAVCLLVSVLVIGSVLVAVRCYQRDVSPFQKLDEMSMGTASGRPSFTHHLPE